MDYYSMVLGAIQKLLADIGQKKYSDVVGECLEKWKNDGDCTMFGREFDKRGRFADYRLDSSQISDIEKGFWTGQTLSALIAMSAQISAMHQRGTEIDLEFMRKNFGVDNEIMTVSKCAGCGRLEATGMDIDKYISKIVIAKKIVDGMEKDNLNEQVESIITVTAPEIEKERGKATARLSNSSIAFTEKYVKVKGCLKCGSSKITEGRLLKSIKENVFVPLGR